MVTEPHVPNFDSSKPAASTTGYPSRFNSEEVRDNFTSLGRANDLRCKAHVPADLMVRVEAGAYSTTSDNTKRFIGGDSPILSMSGGLTGQQKWYVLEFNDTGTLVWNSNGSWDYPSPSTPTVPAYNGGRLPVCEVLVTWDDTAITQDKIRDARPMINLGVGIENIRPGRIDTIAILGQTDFDTSIHFTYTPGLNELLVWCDYSASFLEYRISGGVTLTPGSDYFELDDHTIRFGPAFSFIGGERVIIWKVGVSASPGTFHLNDLSNVSVANTADGGNRSDALVPRLPGDVPSSANPYETYYSHNLIDHLVDVSSLVPVDTHITTVATGTHKHMASEIEILDPGVFTSAVDVQGALDDVETKIYQKYISEHDSVTGGHGPKVTIIQSNNDNALVVTETATSASNVLVVNNNGTGAGIMIAQTGNGKALRIAQSGADNAIYIEKLAASGAAEGILISNSGIGTGIAINQIGNGKGFRVVQVGNENAAVFDKTSTDASATVIVNVNSGSGVGVLVNNSSIGAGLYVNQVSTAAPMYASLFVNTNNAGLNSRSVRIDHRGTGSALYVQKISVEAGSVIEVSNAGNGNDITGNGGSWWVDKSGNSTFSTANVSGCVNIGGFRGTWVTKTIAGNAITVSSINYLIYLNGTGPLTTINGGTDGQIILIQVHPSVGGNIGINTSSNIANVGDGILDWNRPDSLQLVYSAVRGKWCGIIQA